MTCGQQLGAIGVTQEPRRHVVCRCMQVASLILLVGLLAPAFEETLALKGLRMVNSLLKASAVAVLPTKAVFPWLPPSGLLQIQPNLLEQLSATRRSGRRAHCICHT